MIDERIVARLARDARPLRSWPLVGGISAEMTAFEIERADGTRSTHILRRPGRRAVADEEFRILTVLRAAGLPVPPPRFLDPSGEPGYVVDYLEGDLDLSPAHPAEYVERYAEALAWVHGVGFAGLGLPTQNEAPGEPPSMPNEALRETEIRDALGRFVRRPNPSALLHGDFWPGNVLWREGRIVGILDWEEANVGDPLADLAICRLDLLWILGWEAVEALTAAYLARVLLDPHDLPYWDLRASLRPVSNLHEWAPTYPRLGRPDVTEATMARDHALFVARALADATA